MEKLWYAWITRLRAKTPKLWNWIKTICGWVPIVVSAINSATSGAIAPIWYTNYQFYFTAIPALILVFAQSQTKK